MAVLEVVQIGNPVLKAKAEPVEKINKQILKILDDMADTMYASDGVGLAAPQIGVSKRIIIVDIGEGLIELINPEIVSAEGSVVDQEGCLSVAGFFGDVARAQKVVVQGLNRQGKRVKIKAVDFLARALQHEIDHLEGRLFVDLAVNLKKLQATKEQVDE
ncbi:peptide deformylase [Succinispira mobilis]|uniref:peptide deformylase n=1 Tax=Succinispira mobilis TaxID=78120 RepID=UPI0003637234|nr:peptide deformylase [Succinispira mobilis]